MLFHFRYFKKKSLQNFNDTNEGWVNNNNQKVLETFFDDYRRKIFDKNVSLKKDIPTAVDQVKFLSTYDYWENKDTSIMFVLRQEFETNPMFKKFLDNDLWKNYFKKENEHRKKLEEAAKAKAAEAGVEPKWFDKIDEKIKNIKTEFNMILRILMNYLICLIK